jgi:hypothetical protein
MEESKKYNAFISYSHKDKQYAAPIQRSIETLGLPFYKTWRPNVSIFRDERKIPLSGSLSNEIMNGLKSADYLIVIASKNSANSTWVKEEILNWHRLNQDADGFITNFNFILIDDIVEWDSQKKVFDSVKTTALPLFDKPIFKELPLWADLHQYCKGGKVDANNANYQWEVAKVKALLLGKKPDEIIDDVSRSRRWFQIISVAIMLTLSLLTVFAYKQRQSALLNAHEAQMQRDSANAQRVIAQMNARIAQEQRDSALYQKRIADQKTTEAKQQQEIAEQNAERALNLGKRSLVTATLLLNPEGTKFNTVLNTRDDLQFGLASWGLRIGNLKKLLLRFQKEAPETFTRIFGKGGPDEFKRFISYLNSSVPWVSPRSRAEQKMFEDDVTDTATGTNTSQEIELTEEPWLSRLKEAGNDPKLQAIQYQEYSKDYLQFLARLKEIAPNIKSERGIAFMLDLKYQMGSNAAIRMIEKSKRQLGSKGSEAALLESIKNLSVEMMERRRSNFTRAVKMRRENFLNSPYFSDKELGF